MTQIITSINEFIYLVFWGKPIKKIVLANIFLDEVIFFFFLRGGWLGP